MARAFPSTEQILHAGRRMWPPQRPDRFNLSRPAQQWSLCLSMAGGVAQGKAICEPLLKKPVLRVLAGPLRSAAIYASQGPRIAFSYSFSTSSSCFLMW